MTLRDFQRDFNKNFTQNFNKLADLLEGLVSDVAEQVSSPRTKKVLNSALDLFRPHLISLGLRISVLNASQIEIALPAKQRNLDEKGRILAGVQTSAAIEAYKLLWQRNSPEGNFDVVVKSTEARFFKAAKGDLYLRGELSEISRETKWAELSKNKRADHEMTLHLFDDQEQMVAEVLVVAELFLVEMIDWK